MSFKRKLLPEVFKTGDALTQDLIGIGFLLGGKGSETPNIENTIVAASIEGVKGDYRVLALLTDWLSIHLSYVNADRLIQLVGGQRDELLRAYWTAIAQHHSTDRRFLRLARKLRGKKFDLVSEGSDFQIRRKGHDPRFERTCLRVPAGTLRSRPGDLMTPSELAKRHLPYRCRVQMGPSYRADMWATLSQMPNLSASELARSTHGSFSSAWKTMRDFKLLAY